MRKFTFVVFAAIAGVGFMATTPKAQARQEPLVGAINGIVKARTGSAISEATLTATNLDSDPGDNPDRSTVSGPDGAYAIVDLPPGRYSITARKSGYRTCTVPLVTVADGEAVGMGAFTMVRATGGSTARCYRGIPGQGR